MGSWPCRAQALGGCRAWDGPAPGIWRTATGLARLEFALAVIVASVIAALALHRIAQLQVFAQAAGAKTTAAQARSVSALATAREPTFNTSAASTPRPSTPSEAPVTGAVP